MSVGIDPRPLAAQPNTCFSISGLWTSLMSGTTKPLKPEDYAKETGKAVVATKDEMNVWIAVTPQGESGDITWSDEDEFYVERPPPAQIIETCEG